MLKKIIYKIPEKNINWLINNKYIYEMSIKLFGYIKCGYILNLDNPVTMNEKINYRKINGNFEFYANNADKYKVRNYVEKKIGKEYLIPMLGVYNKLVLEDLDKLPSKYILKANHGAGGALHEIIFDNKTIDKEKIVKKINDSLKIDYGSRRGEKYYSVIKRKILAEELIGNPKEELADYKFHCFNSEKNGFKTFIQYISERNMQENKYRVACYDSNWKKLDISFTSKGEKIEKDIKVPLNFSKMVEVAKKLSEDYDYVRVDLYNVDGKIYFGELTHTPGNGFLNFESIALDKKIGDMWEIQVENKLLYK